MSLSARLLSLFGGSTRVERILRWWRLCDAQSIGWVMMLTLLALWLFGEVLSLAFGHHFGWGIGYYMGFHPNSYGLKHQPWGIATYMWWHRDFFSVSVNALCLYGLSLLYEGFDRGRGFALTFFWGGLSGAVCYALSALLADLWGLGHIFPLYGASAGVCALAFRLAMSRPGLRVKFIGLRFNFLFLILLVYILTTLVNTNNVGGILAHLGGAFYGVVRALSSAVSEVNEVITKSKETAEPLSPEAERTAVEDKLRQSGYRSLSPEEQEKL